MLTSTKEPAFAVEMPPYVQPSGTEPTVPVTTAQRPALRTVGFYGKALSKSLDPKIFRPNPKRLGWFGFTFLGIAGSLVAMVSLDPIWPVKLLLGLFIGFCTGALAFATHELFHGSIVRNQKLQHFLGFFGLTPFLIAPTYWVTSHNRLHHAKAQQLVRDPDAFPNLRIYKTSKYMKFMFPFTPGSKSLRSYLYFFFWFTAHNLGTQLYFRFKNKSFDGMNHTRASIELAAQVLIIAGVAIAVGPQNWLWALVIPFLAQNYLLMSYISTNHNLSPLTNENDPLANTLSVSNHPVLEFLHLNFGYHVEHHIFPTVSGAYTKQIHKELVRQFPETYKIMPKWDAVRSLYKTARIYKNHHELIHPDTHDVFPTL